MKKRIIVITNIVVIAFLFVGVSISSSLSKENYIKVQQDAFEKETTTSQEILSNYLHREQAAVDSWSYYIGSRNLTIEEGFEYLKNATIGDSFAIHIIDKETMQGYTTTTSAGRPDDYTVDYTNQKGVSETDTASYVISHASIGSGSVNMLPCFSDLITGQKVVGFCQNVTLNNGGVNKDGIIVRYILQSKLASRWIIGSTVDNAYTGIIDGEGLYVMKPSKMKFTSFYEFIYSYNRNAYTATSLRELMASNESGSFTANDANDISTFYSFAKVKGLSSTIILINAVRTSEFSQKSVDNAFVFLADGVLVSLLLINMAYFVIKQRQDLATNAILKESVEKTKKQDELLNVALEEAKAASKAKTEFLHNMSHDIRTPMNAIIGYTAIAQENIDNPQKIDDSLNKIASSSKHLLGLINDILDMSRIESGKITLDCQEHDISEIMRGIKNVVQAGISAKGLSFQINSVNVEHINIICDKVALNQVLINLLGNAIKFTNSGGHISVLVEELPYQNDGKANYRFVVEDDGIGMSKEFLGKIFNEFERERNSTVSKTTGTGLGMSITKRLVDLMGGSINVESEKDKGSRFEVNISFDIAKEHSVENYSINELVDARALVVDDNFNCCESVTKMLTRIGMRSDWTLYGKEAVLKAKNAHDSQDPYDVYIIDWVLGDTNGIEVVKQVRAVIGDDTPIIVMTAYDWTNIQDEAEKAGVTCFLAKPLFIDDLSESLKNAIKKEQQGVFSKAKEEIKHTGKRCLLVEDNDFNREIATFYLEGLGLSVECAENGQVAVDKVLADASAYDIVFMDIQMPVMNGYEATDAIRGSGLPGTDTLPIIAMTANAFKVDIERCLSQGMNGFISKPIDKDKLNEVLAGTLHNY